VDFLPVKTDPQFGGDWTEQKLEILRKYLSAYTTALSKQRFQKTYIDAFAGSGLREVRPRRVEEQRSLVEHDEEQSGFLEGSARIALKTTPPFDRYVFVEKDPSRCAHLEALKMEFPRLADRIVIRNKEANDYIREICRSPWARNRAVLFLDPYGTQVKWRTIEAVAKTQAIDLWLLFPVGVGVNRMLTQSGDIPESWQRTLDEILGPCDWRETFYRKVKQDTLFGELERIEKASIGVISQFFLDRLSMLFAGVADNPAVLRNSKRSPLYLFCFAAGNPAGAKLALKIARDILEKMGS
jgi:three-Cys-motif partner protein